MPGPSFFFALLVITVSFHGRAGSPPWNLPDSHRTQIEGSQPRLPGVKPTDALGIEEQRDRALAPAGSRASAPLRLLAMTLRIGPGIPLC